MHVSRHRRLSGREQLLDDQDQPTEDDDKEPTPRRVTRSGRGAPTRTVRKSKRSNRQLENPITSESEPEKSSPMKEDEDELPLEWDTFQAVAAQMQQQYDNRRQSANAEETAAAGEDMFAALQDETPATRSTPLKRQRDREESDHEEDWEVRDGQTPRALLLNANVPGRFFNFAQRQMDAVQIEWNSQTPRGSSARASSSRPDVPYDHQGEFIDKARVAERSSRTRKPTVARKSLPAIRPQAESPPSPMSAGSRQSDRARSYSPIPSVSLPSSPPPIRASGIHPRQGLATDTARQMDVQDGKRSRLARTGAALEEEEVEMVEGNDSDIGDLMPDTQQLMGELAQSSMGPRTPTESVFDDIMPSESQMLGTLAEPNGSRKTGQSQLARVTDNSLAVIRDDQVLDYQFAGDVDVPEPVTEESAPPMPRTTQRLLASQRSRKSGEASDFVSPDQSSDEEDRVLLHQGTQPTHERESSVLRNHIATSPPVEPASSPEEAFIDPFLVDEEGHPLEPNPKYRMPHNFVQQRSRIHGRIGDQSTSYSRISGRRKWTKTEELLLYRTLQQVPWEEPYPIRVVWCLHGEYGVLSHDLEDFNPQHMKDKMRTTVQARWNNQREVNGRARAFLSGTNPLRQDYEREVEQWRAARKRELRNARMAESQTEEPVRRKESAKKRRARDSEEEEAESSSSKEEEEEEETIEVEVEEDHRASRRKSRRQDAQERLKDPDYKGPHRRTRPRLSDPDLHEPNSGEEPPARETRVMGKRSRGRPRGRGRGRGGSTRGDDSRTKLVNDENEQVEQVSQNKMRQGEGTVLIFSLMRMPCRRVPLHRNVTLLPDRRDGD